MDGSALVVTNGILDLPNAKTAHGLIRGSDRFHVVGLIDHRFAGRDAGEALDGKSRGIPIFATLEAALDSLAETPDFFVVGIATHGGRITEELREHILGALGRGLSVVNGLHGFVADDAELKAAANASGARIIDVRRTPPRQQLHFWEGKIYDVRAPRIAVLGTDCAIGKRTTCRWLVEALNTRGLRAQMIYTGQTGWMQGAEYGFIFDSVPNDFVSGELEHAICRCDQEASPDLIVLEGQSSLRNPAGPAGAEFLASGVARGVVLQHAPGRPHYEGYAELPEAAVAPLAEELQLISLYGSRVIAIALNGEGLSPAQLERQRERIEAELGIPVSVPLRDGIENITAAAVDFLREERGG